MALRSSIRVAFLMAFVSAARVLADAPSQNGAKEDTAQMVEDAAQAEIRGDFRNSTELLQDATKADRKNSLAHWRLGEVQVNKQWMRVEDAQQRAAIDPRQAEYRQLRMQTGGSLEEQVELAKWCRKKRMADEARYHWANVLALDLNNSDALHALDVKWVRGRLMTSAEIAADKNAEKVRQREKLAADIAKWRRGLEGLNSITESDVIEGIRSIRYPEAILAIEEFIEHPTMSKQKETGEQAREKAGLRDRLCLAYAYALAGMPQPTATEALTRMAVWSFQDISVDAIEELKKRPKYDYVPLLLNGLDLPVQVPTRVETSTDGRVTCLGGCCRLCRTADTAVTPSFFSQRPDGTFGATRQRMAEIFARGQEIAKQTQAISHNQKVSETNPRFVDVLQKTTGQNLGNDPNAWWSWWQNENEFYSVPKQPVYQDAYRTVAPYQYIEQCLSCFAKGTPVWTKAGKQPIESLGAGDQVLSQNVETGELRYEPVLERTVRPKTALIKISVDGESITATKGHPFWVAGNGWRMVKELEDGAVLCGIHQGTRVRSIEAAGEAEAYNLVVAEFSTYFVGETGILVHDNAPRKPTEATVPGILPK